jgi:hypothetical protein
MVKGAVRLHPKIADFLQASASLEGLTFQLIIKKKWVGVKWVNEPGS